MNLIETLEKLAAETQRGIADCSRLERERIAEINSISAEDVRGKPSKVSERISALDAERRRLVDTRRALKGELALGLAALEKARSVVVPNKPKPPKGK